MTHSILFAIAIGIAAGIYFGGNTLERFGQGLLFFAITCSHGVLDAMTDGGLGIAFFSPFDPTRYFLPWRPIRVSPIGAAFFSSRGLAVIWSEVLWVWGPALVVGLILYACRRLLEARLRAESVTPSS